MGTVTLSSANLKARKDHKCNFCGGNIEKGTEYQRQGFVCDNQVYTWKSHLRCDKLCSKLRMYDDCDEGVTNEDFYETICVEYYNLFGDNKRLTFQERLDIVCNHYQIN